MAVTEFAGRSVPVITPELAIWLKNGYEEYGGKWCKVTRDPGDGLIRTVGPAVEVPENLKEQAAQYLLDLVEAFRQNVGRRNGSVWASLGVPYSDNPALAAAAELGNGAGIELIKQQEGQLGLEEKVAVLSSLYEQALSNWEKELKRANKLQRIVDSYRVRPPAEVPWIYDGNVYQSIPDPNPCIPGKFLDWSKEP